MKRDSIAFLISGTMFGLLIGWIIGSQQTGPAVQAPASAAAPAGQPAAPQPAPPPLDAGRVAELERIANAEPANQQARVDLGNLYFNAERFAEAVPWYEAALTLDPRDVNASTDLGVCYYYLQQDDRALAQFAHSLSVDPDHVKTLFNQGVVRAFGKQDLEGATAAWERVVALAPESEEGRRASQIIEGLKSGHSGAGGPAAPGNAPGRGSE
jgi:cytochrome c-type biogenesis protein CcmH/NrfG